MSSMRQSSHSPHAITVRGGVSPFCVNCLCSTSWPWTEESALEMLETARRPSGLETQLFVLLDGLQSADGDVAHVQQSSRRQSFSDWQSQPDLDFTCHGLSILAAERLTPGIGVRANRMT